MRNLKQLQAPRYAGSFRLFVLGIKNCLLSKGYPEHKNPPTSRREALFGAFSRFVAIMYNSFSPINRNFTAEKAVAFATAPCYSTNFYLSQVSPLYYKRLRVKPIPLKIRWRVQRLPPGGGWRRRRLRESALQ